MANINHVSIQRRNVEEIIHNKLTVDFYLASTACSSHFISGLDLILSCLSPGTALNVKAILALRIGVYLKAGVFCNILVSLKPFDVRSWLAVDLTFEDNL